jgi:hypothetical protein
VAQRLQNDPTAALPRKPQRRVIVAIPPLITWRAFTNELRELKLRELVGLLDFGGTSFEALYVSGNYAFWKIVQEVLFSVSFFVVKSVR